MLIRCEDHARELEEAFAVAEEDVDDRQVVISPSGQYRLSIATYRSPRSSMGLARAVVRRVGDDAVVCEIRRDDNRFPYSFVSRGSGEWLITGRSYVCQTVIDLGEGRVHQPQTWDDDGFIWTDARLSPDGRTLAVEGCHWACPYQICFFDFTDPSLGWPELSTALPDRTWFAVDSDGWWADDGSFACDLVTAPGATKTPVVLRRDGEAIAIVGSADAGER